MDLSEQILAIQNPPKLFLHKGGIHSKRQKKLLHFKKKTRKELKKRARRKSWVKRGKPTKDGRLIAKDPKYFETLDAPSNFSLVHNTEEVLEYFEKCGNTFNQRKQVIFNLTDIENLTPDAIALLIAKVQDPRFTHKISYKGTHPKNPELSKLLNSSGFLNHVSSGIVTGVDHENRLIHKITDKKVENELAKEICELAVKHTFIKPIKFKPLYETIIECMANTNNHAGLGVLGKYDWWIHLYKDPVSKISYFTFLDLGVGIFDSLPVKNYLKNKVKTLLTSVKDKISIDLVPKFDPDIIPDLFSGEMSITRTKEETRGKGLPLIQEHSRDASIRNFTIITNKGLIKLPSLENKVLANKFNGTLLYWELHPIEKT